LHNRALRNASGVILLDHDVTKHLDACRNGNDILSDKGLTSKSRISVMFPARTPPQSLVGTRDPSGHGVAAGAEGLIITAVSAAGHW
jgi:hypothetical protein